MTPRQICADIARELRKNPYSWTAGAMARDEFGAPTAPHWDAVCWCIEGHVAKRTETIAEQYQVLSRLSAVCGEKELYLWNDRPGLVEGLQRFSESWPRSGMTRNGTAYRLPTLAPLTDAIESGLLPTPAATSYGSNQGGAAGRIGPIRPSLETMARKGLWPTPTVTGNNNVAGRWQKSGDGLATAVRTMVSEAELNGPLNPTWVEWLMGFPLEWTALEPSAMPSSRKSRKSSAGQS